MKFLTTIQNGLRTACFAVRKNSPQILMVSGVIGCAASFVLACKSSIKAVDILEKNKETLEIIKSHPIDEEYTEEDQKHDKFILACKTSWDLIKTYALPVIVGVISVGSLVVSNRILTKRNIALTAAYTTLNTMFKDYRDNVVERFGSEVDYQLLNNIKAVKEKVTDENGNEVETDKTVYVADKTASHSVYGTYIDDTWDHWSKHPMQTMSNLKHFEDVANRMLWQRGHMTVNDVYDLMGLPRCEHGGDWGWKYYANGDNPCGDNRIDFGLTTKTAQDKFGLSRFEQGLEDTVYLNFNVDGPVIAMFTNEDYQRRYFK